MKTSFLANKFINFGKGIDVLKKLYDNDYVKTIIICYNKEEVLCVLLSITVSFPVHQSSIVIDIKHVRGT